jgi:hypothetical protein
MCEAKLITRLRPRDNKYIPGKRWLNNVNRTRPVTMKSLGLLSAHVFSECDSIIHAGLIPLPDGMAFLFGQWHLSMMVDGVYTSWALGCDYVAAVKKCLVIKLENLARGRAGPMRDSR